MKFKVGDLVQPIEDLSSFGFPLGEVVPIVDIYGNQYTIRVRNANGLEDTFFEERFELVEPKQTKNQRITALEKEVAELKTIVHQLRESNITLDDVKRHFNITPSIVEDIIEFEGKQYKKVDRLAREGDVVSFKEHRYHNSKVVTAGKFYEVFKDYINDGKLSFWDNEGDSLLVYGGGISKGTPETVDVYELIVEDKPKIKGVTIELEKPKTANELRGEIIEKAKVFVEERIGCYQAVPDSSGGAPWTLKDFEFITNEDKRTVVVLCRGHAGTVRERGIAKCNPSDVFNAHIGKAIALGRALGLGVSEFEQAVQPTEVAVGMIAVDSQGDVREVKEGHDHDGYPVVFANDTSSTLKIINDTNAIYGGVE